MLDWIARDSSHFDALLINPVGAVDSERYRSALEISARPSRPVIEVHLDNIFRKGDNAPKPLPGPDGETGLVCGLGLHSYSLGIRAIAERLQR
jgi:3-dehydroquinate dehydratase